MNYKVGDDVRVISRDEVHAGDLTDEGFRVNGYLFNSDMEVYCDRTFKITKVHTLSERDTYTLDTADRVGYNNRSWMFTREMIRLVDRSKSVNGTFVNHSKYREDLL